jgi:hypothetical protein
VDVIVSIPCLMRGHVVNEIVSPGYSPFLTKTFQWQRLNNAKLDAKLVTEEEFERNIRLEEHKYLTKTNVFCDVR